MASYREEFWKVLPKLNPFVTPKEPSDLVARFALSGSHYSISAGLIWTLMGMIQMFAYLSDLSQFGPAIAVSLLGLFYALVLSELFFRFILQLNSGGVPSQAGDSRRSSLTAIVLALTFGVFVAVTLNFT
jgi:thiamine transporter ThiT